MFRIIPLDMNNTRHVEAAFVLRMKPDNAPGVDIAREFIVGNTPETYAAWVAKRLEWHPHAVGVAIQEGNVVGLYECGIAPTQVENGGYLFAVHTAEHLRGQGLGRALMQAAEAVLRGQGCTSYRLTTVEQNTSAHAFYRRMGLEFVGTRAGKPYLWMFEKKL